MIKHQHEDVYGVRRLGVHGQHENGEYVVTTGIGFVIGAFVIILVTFGWFVIDSVQFDPMQDHCERTCAAQATESVAVYDRIARICRCIPSSELNVSDGK